ncbi:hypothetical protein [Halobacteriovorax sp.]|uniref:hypothetical protein n=1 Tax=Halobacteriovorax sp. TaxID=2020862 RepID=UPI003567E3C2
MKKLILLAAAFTSIASVSANVETSKSIDFYQDAPCSEMINLNSEDEFIRFAANEITRDLGKDVCSRVQSIESLEFGEMAREGEISAVQFGKLIESIHNAYTLGN